MTSKTTNKFSSEVRARAVRMVQEHGGEYPSRWAAVVSVAEKIGCSAHTLNEWVMKAEVDSGKRAGVTTDTAERLKALERENRELRQANEILRKASAYFAQAELDRPSAGFCRSPHRATMSTLPSVAILAGGLPDPGVMRPSSLRSCGSLPRTSASTACVRSGGRLSGRGLVLPDAASRA